MRKIKFAFTQAILMTFLLISLFGSLMLIPTLQHLSNHPFQKKILPKWTYMVYLDADNNLDSYGIDDLNEMEDGYLNSASGDVNVIVFIDRYYSGGTTYKIVEDHNTGSIASPTLTTGFPSEPDMGSKTTLKNFITYVFNNFPAEHYVLDLWDHGGGIFGICWDDSDGDNRLTFDEVDEALSEACSAAGERIDILAMDACLMHMLEVDYEMRDYVDFIVASEETIPGSGYPYDDIISSICNNPSQSATTFAIDMVNDYHNSYSSSYDTTLSAVDVRSTGFDTLMTAFNNFVAQIQSLDRNLLSSARAATQEFYYDFFVDLKDFCNEVAARTSGAVKTAAELLNDSISNVVINSQQHNNPDAYGISIYFPDNADDYDSGYETVIDLGQDTEWDDFLNYFYYGLTYSLAMTGYTFDDSSGGDNDSIVEQGETVNLTVTIKNTGSETAYTINGTIACSDGNITINTGFQSYRSSLPPGNTASKNFQFNVSSLAPTRLVITFTFTINATFIDSTVVNYYRVYQILTVIDVSTIMGGADFDSAVSIDSQFTNDIAILNSLLPGPDPTDFGSWFKVMITSTEGYLISGIIEGPADSDFDIYIYTPSHSLLSVAGKSTYPDYCSAILPETGEYRIRVVPYNGTGLYVLNVTKSPYPGPEDGLNWGTAYTLNRNTTFPVQGTIPHEGENYIIYRFYLHRGEAITAKLDGDPSQHDFDMYLVDNTFHELTHSYSSTYPERLDYSADYTGYYYLMIIPFSGSGDFTLSIEFKEAFTLSTTMIIIIVVIVVAAILIGLYIFFKMSH